MNDRNTGLALGKTHAYIGVCPHDSAPHPTRYVEVEATSVEEAVRLVCEQMPFGHYVSRVVRKADQQTVWTEANR